MIGVSVSPGDAIFSPRGKLEPTVDLIRAIEDRCRLSQGFVVAHTSDEISWGSLCATLRDAFIVNEEESEEHEIGDWESNPGYHVDRLCYSDRMRRLFFPQLKTKNFVTVTRPDALNFRVLNYVFET